MGKKITHSKKIARNIGKSEIFYKIDKNDRKTSYIPRFR